MADNKSYKKSNFGGAFFFLPEEKKEALSIIYTFCRLADDIVDEGYSDAKERLADLRKEIKLVFEGAPSTELGKDLKKVIKAFPIPEQYFTDLIDGVERDLDNPVRFDTLGDLKWYMYRVASIVGLMCIEIFGYKNPNSKEYAEAMGYAVQLTNIVRDICPDSKINRLYIPKEDLESFGVSEQDLFSCKDTRKVNALLFFEMERAQDYYNKARSLLPKEDFKSLLAARAMGNIYEAILKKLQKTPCRLGGKKIKLSKLEKVKILIKTWRENP